jgi:two-component sensor histidine kinase
MVQLSTLSTLFWLLVLVRSPVVFSQSSQFAPNPEKLRYAQEVKQEAQLKKDSLLLAEAYYLYGKTYFSAGDIPTSKSYFLKSLHILEPQGDSYELGRLYLRLCEDSRAIDHTKEEIRYAYLAKAIFERIKSPKGQMNAYMTLGQIYRRRTVLSGINLLADSSLIYFKKAERLSYQLKDTLGIADVSVYLGDLHLGRNDLRAVVYLQKALRFYLLKESVRPQLNAMILLGRAYLNIGKIKKGRAVIYQAEQLYNDQDFNDNLLALALDEALISYYEKTNQWQRAYERFRALFAKQNVQFAADRDGALARLQVEYDTEKKENKLKAQALELSLTNQNLYYQRIIAVGSSLLFLIAGSLSILFFRLYRKNQRISQENEYLVMEQKHRSQNNLQMLSSLFNMQARLFTDPGSKRAMEENQLRILSMALIQRKLDEDTQSGAIDLSQFIPELTSGILHAYGYSQIETRLTIDPIVLNTDQAVPIGLILNELITNACKYAFPGNPNPILIMVCQRKRDVISLAVRDNGPGLTKNNNTTGNSRTFNKDSFGMQLIQVLVEQIRGTYTIDSAEGTIFNLRFTSRSEHEIAQDTHHRR